MLHIPVLIDAKPENHEKFLQWLTTRKKTKTPTGVQGGWDLQIREMKIYDIVVPEENAEEWIADIKALKGYGGCLPNRRQKIQNVIKWFGKIAGLKSAAHIEPTKDDIKQNAVSNWWVHAFVLGMLEDPHVTPERRKKNKNLPPVGKEML